MGAAHGSSTASWTSEAAQPRLGGTELLLVLGAVPLWAVSVWWMHAMDMQGRFDAGALAPFLVMWVVMMGAMMLPSVAPAVGVHRRVMRRRALGGANTTGWSAAFVTGYLAAWTAVGVVAFAALRLLSAGLGDLSDADLARRVIAPTALAAAIYQATPLKRTCLRRCRSPFDFLLSRWREGRAGALRMGIEHGAYCVGCCVMLMAVLVAFGAASVTWMALVAAAIAGEKLLPPRLVGGGVLLAVALAVLGLVALVEPSLLPGLGGMGDIGGQITMGS